MNNLMFATAIANSLKAGLKVDTFNITNTDLFIRVISTGDKQFFAQISISATDREFPFVVEILKSGEPSVFEKFKVPNVKALNDILNWQL